MNKKYLIIIIFCGILTACSLHSESFNYHPIGTMAGPGVFTGKTGKFTMHKETHESPQPQLQQPTMSNYGNLKPIEENQDPVLQPQQEQEFKEYQEFLEWKKWKEQQQRHQQQQLPVF